VTGGHRTIGSTIAEAAGSLEAAGFDEARRHARRLVAAALGLSAAEIFAHPERRLDDRDSERIARLARRASAHEPLSRMLGIREFWGLDFRLSTDVFDPRPETETVVAAALARLPEHGGAYRLLDLGTGSGCLLSVLLAERPHATGIGIDRSPGAAETARANAAALGLGGRARFVVADWAACIAGEFDAVVANPPYIATGAIAGLPPEVRDHDPRRALDGGDDGLNAYRAIAAELPGLLAPGGFFAAEIGAGQNRAVSEILAAQGLEVEAFVDDLAGIRRCVVARTRKRLE
jgi:release factor glutamine methyltransferase